MGVKLDLILIDWVYGFILFGFIMFIVYFVKSFPNIWVNRKFIHLSSIPAVFFYMYIFSEPYVFFFFSMIFTVILFIKHVRNDLSEWFQVKRNYGEVFFTISYGVVSIIFWPNYKIFAGVIMLFMALGDSITGLVRSRFVKKRQKHWTGSLAMLIVCSLLGLYFYGLWGVILSILATIAEAQPYLDDNLSVPIITAVAGLLLIL